MRFLPAAALAIALAATPTAARSQRDQRTRERVEGLYAGLVENLERGERLREEDARSRGERVADLERGRRLLGLAAVHLQRGSRNEAVATVAEVEDLLSSIEPDRGHFAGELVASEAGNARRAAGLAREAIERGERSRGLAALRIAGRYTARARDIAAASVLPLFEE